VLLVAESGAHGQDLIESSNGGASWTVVYRGAVGSLLFATPQRGFALAESAGGTPKMIATDDGGQHWVPVRL
jgi:photosystem II stability/assembly factor-like uncharacterized protein